MEIDPISCFGNNIPFFLLSYSILGAGLKYIDVAFDEKTVNMKVALAISPFIGILWVYTMIINGASAAILSAIILGVLIRGKIDNPAHLLGLFTILFVILISGLKIPLLLLVFLTASAYMDEVGNDIIDRKEINSRFVGVFLKYFFGKRWLLKVAVLYLVLLGLFPMYLLVALIFFDESYLLVEEYGKAKLEVER